VNRLYFSSNRGASNPNNADIYLAQRPSTSDPWGPPQNIGSTINTPATENNPSFSRDGHWMFFNSNRSPGGFGDTD
jgi:Tol biopolymer transport system component